VYLNQVVQLRLWDDWCPPRGYGCSPERRLFTVAKPFQSFIEGLPWEPRAAYHDAGWPF
jgi:hypothetical protein